MAPKQQTMAEQVDALRTRLIREALSRHEGNLAAVARELDTPKRSLGHYLDRYGLRAYARRLRAERDARLYAA